MKNQYKLLIRVFFPLFFFCLFFNPTFGQKKKKSYKSIFRALQYQQVAQVTIKTNLDSLINYRNRSTYQKGTFTYISKSGKLLKHKIKLRPRGKYRRKICHFPMIKIDFSKKELKKHKYAAKYDDYKLVTHCLKWTNISYENVAREFLAYKLYNILSPNSYQVQFLYLHYIDANEKIPTIEQAGFMIEDTAEMEDRVKGEVRDEIAGLLRDSFDIEQYNFVALFQYMIGNTDWAAYPIPRNVKAIKLEGAEKYSLIPFDFDFSGLVNAIYAVPQSNINQKSVRHRVFQGIKDNPESLQPSIEHFLSKKKKIIRCIKHYTLLSRKSRKDILSFINPFFRKLEKKDPLLLIK